jgi:hypothetical protein
VRIRITNKYIINCKMIWKIIVLALVFFSIVNTAHQSNLKYQVVKVIIGTDTSNSNYAFYLLSNGVAKVYNITSSLTKMKIHRLL